MKTYEITLKPVSGFGTPLKGDTLFGHICWQAAYDASLFGTSIDELLADYSEKPFLTVSSAFPKAAGMYAFKRPDMPLDCLFEFGGQSKADIIRNRKDYKSKRWMLIRERIQSLKSSDLYLSDGELFAELKKSFNDEIQRELRNKGVKSFISDYSQPHNSINRLTGTTGEGGFAPFAVDQRVYFPQAELSVFAAIDDTIIAEQVRTAFCRIGECGFGKDASTGLGKFEVCNIAERDLFTLGSDQPNACYTLSPCVPEKAVYKEMFFSPFTRFGRHGDVLAKSTNPFKNPVIMADEGAVFVPNDRNIFQKPFIGTAIGGISKIKPNAVAQGYSLYIPVRVEV